ncbi:MAG: PDR/VanB family oxidoreductase [Pseudomonadota bacterium]
MDSHTLAVRVAKITQKTADISAFELVHPDGLPLPSFEAGAHIDVQTPGGLVRQYSLCNAPGEVHRYRIGVLHDPGSRGGSRAMHQQLQAGDLLGISAPRNHFRLEPSAQVSLLFAGGIGITPILCMAHALRSAGKAFTLHYCARSRERAAFLDELAGQQQAGDVRLHFDDLGAEQKLRLEQAIPPPQAGTHLYVCGPRPFMDAVLGQARDGGWPEAQLHYEFFKADVPTERPEKAFMVQIASSGRMVPVAAHETVLQALASVGIAIESSCEQGVCGTCLTGVLAGEPDHRDSYLVAAEQQKNDQFLPCCSRARSEVLVLDL